jgi:type IV pilus assembly protein PilN
MLNIIDINLLPEKEKKSSLFVYSIAIILLLFFVACLFFFFSLRSVQTETVRTVEGLSQTKKIIEVQQTKLLDSESSQGARQLEETIEWMTNYPIETVPVLNELISLLPPRGFIQTFEYSERQSINASIQFDSSRDAAYYLHHIKEVEWIREAEILEITTNNMTSEEIESEERAVPRYLADFSLSLDSVILQESDDTSLEEEGEE